LDPIAGKEGRWKKGARKTRRGKSGYYFGRGNRTFIPLKGKGGKEKRGRSKIKKQSFSEILPRGPKDARGSQSGQFARGEKREGKGRRERVRALIAIYKTSARGEKGKRQ